MKKKEILIISCIFVAALLLWSGSRLFRPEGSRVRISVNGEEYGVYSLSQDQKISINDTNVLEIKDGSAAMISATCPDHLCMKQKAIHASGSSIICLPNKIVIEGIDGP